MVDSGREPQLADMRRVPLQRLHATQTEKNTEKPSKTKANMSHDRQECIGERHLPDDQLVLCRQSDTKRGIRASSFRQRLDRRAWDVATRLSVRCPRTLTRIASVKGRRRGCLSPQSDGASGSPEDPVQHGRRSTPAHPNRPRRLAASPVVRRASAMTSRKVVSMLRTESAVQFHPWVARFLRLVRCRQSNHLLECRNCGEQQGSQVLSSTSNTSHSILPPQSQMGRIPASLGERSLQLIFSSN